MVSIKKLLKTLFGNLIEEESLIACIKTAIRCKNLREFERLINNNYLKFSDYQNEEGYCLLHYCSEEGAEEILTKLLESGYYNVDIRSNEMHTPLHVSASYGSIQVAKTLLKFGADVNARDVVESSEMVRTPLHNAIISNQKEMVKFLLEEGANIEVSCNMGNALLTAMSGGDKYGIVKMLLEYGADPKSTTWGGYTALHYDALSAESEGMLREFIDLGVPVDVKKDDGATPLFETIQFDSIDNAKLLISMGADVNSTDNMGENILHKIAGMGDSRLGMAFYFILIGANVNAKSIYGETPLHIAAKSHNNIDSTIQILIDNGANVNAENAMRWTPLDVAIKKGNEKKASLLRRHGGISGIQK